MMPAPVESMSVRMRIAESPCAECRAFVDNELLVVIAMVAVWLGVSLPIYGQAIRSIERRGVLVGPAHHLACFAAALLVPPLLVGLLCAVERAVDWAREVAVRRRDRKCRRCGP